MPSTKEEIQQLINDSHAAEQIEQQILKTKEKNPMLGNRGVRMGITIPEIYQMQIKAIFDAMFETGNHDTEIMIPLVSNIEELRFIKNQILNIAKNYPIKLNFSIGTMIETPRSILIAKELAKEVDFFSFGTNDLTQMTYGISRDDFHNFSLNYFKNNIITQDIFNKLDLKGVGKLIEIAVKAGKKSNPDLKLGICGEQITDSQSLEFLQNLGFDYISCNSDKIIKANIISAQNQIKNTITPLTTSTASIKQ